MSDTGAPSAIHRRAGLTRKTVPPAQAEWDFTIATGSTFRSVDGTLTLKNAAGSSVSTVDDNGVGRAARFNGESDYLELRSEDAGVLDVAQHGNQVSVFALVRRRSSGTGFIAGMWQEDDLDPRRQYGLFIDLPTYGGAEQVIGHVSSDGKPSPGLPYSRDYSATARMVGLDCWRVIGFTYDGAHIRSYLDGIADSRPPYTEPGAPIGAGLTYSKNPYSYPNGLNRGVRSDFTVGAVQLSKGPGNHFSGDIARIGVWHSALSAEMAFELAVAWTPPGNPVTLFDFSRTPDAVTRAAGGWGSMFWPPAVAGWQQKSLTEKCAHSDAFRINSVHGVPYLSRATTGNNGPALVYIDHLAGLTLGELATVSVTATISTGCETIRLALRCGHTWLMSKPIANSQTPWSVTPVDETWKRLDTDKVEPVSGDEKITAVGIAAFGDGAESAQVFEVSLRLHSSCLGVE